MKKASKIILIFSGILGILISLAFLYLSVFFALGYVVETGVGIFLEIRQLTTLTTAEEVFTSLFSAILTFGIPGLIIILFAVITFVGFLFMLLGAIFTFVASKKNSKKAHHIMSIVFNTLGVIAGLPFLYLGCLYTLYFIVLFIVVIILLLTPIGWLIVSFIAISIGNIILFNIMLLGNIFGFIAIAKQKKQEEIESQEVIENVE